jgi:hypothetical protein
VGLAIILTVLVLIAVLGSVLGWRTVRQLRAKGYVGPFSPFVVTCVVMVAALLAPLTAAFTSTGIALRDLSVPSTVSSSAVALSIVAALATAPWYLPELSRRRFGDKRTRAPWRLLTWVLGLGTAGTLAAWPFVGIDVLRLLQVLLPATLFAGAYSRRASQSAVAEELARDVRPPVVYLRSFISEKEVFAVVRRHGLVGTIRDWWTALEAQYGPSRQYLTCEQFLAAEARRRLGPFVGLGDPTEYLPPDGGAVREYAHDDAWQKRIERLADQAGCFVTTAAHTEGLRWELGLLRDRQYHTRLFVLIPPASASTFLPTGRLRRVIYLALTGGTMRRFATTTPDDWAATVANLAAAGLVVKCELPKPGTVLAFAQAGTGVVVRNDAVAASEYLEAMQSWLAAAPTRS